MADCGTFDIGCKIGSAVSGAASSILGDIASAITDAVGKAVASLGSFWVAVPTPTLGSLDGTGSDPVQFLQGSLWWYMTAAAVVATIVGGARMALAGRGQPGRDTARGLVTLAAVNAAGTAVMAALVLAGDAFSVWIIAQSLHGTDFGANVTTMLGLSVLSGIGVIIVIVLGILAVIASLVQIALMFCRGAMLVLITGLLPTAASFTSTETGRVWFRKVTAWSGAFLLYKPVAAIVYATAFRLVGANVFGSNGIAQVVAGLMLMLSALFALPALMRFAVPVVAVLASDRSGGGGAGAIAGATAGVVASGAQVVQAHRGAPGGSGGRGGPPGAAGPSGASGPTPPAGGGGGGGRQLVGAGARPGGGAAGGGAAGGGAAGGSAAGGAAAGGGAAAAAAAGPAGVAVAGAQVAKAAGQKATGAVRGVTNQTTGEGSPSGSR